MDQLRGFKINVSVQLRLSHKGLVVLPFFTTNSYNNLYAITQKQVKRQDIITQIHKLQSIIYSTSVDCRYYQEKLEVRIIEIIFKVTITMLPFDN